MNNLNLVNKHNLFQYVLINSLSNLLKIPTFF
jgi:hypothetical protein